MVAAARRLGERAEPRGREALEPGPELVLRQDLLHELCFAKPRREEIVERGLVGERRGAIALVPAARALAHLELQRRVLRRARRSEERRVGKEWRSRWSPQHQQKNEQVNL